MKNLKKKIDIGTPLMLYLCACGLCPRVNDDETFQYDTKASYWYHK
ncbi:hypothetical protein PV797_09455 [Clostridiaceae bacterium M8S5]|nr:hypothetical protein PV797_09455 [Clostridiaceae bacterium M8S5]